jgi:ATP-dependent DNA helicase PIF1
MEKDYFDLINALAQAVRRSNELFGGMVVILAGDFMQLAGFGGEDHFVFLSNTWKLAVADGSLLLKNLTIQKRQKDMQFQKILTELRFAELSPASIAALKQRVDDSFINDPKDWTREFYAIRAKVEASNRAQLASLDGVESTFLSVDNGAQANLEINCPSMKGLVLKVGARVMALVNTPDYKNGSMGYVDAIGESSVTVRFDHSSEKTVVITKYLFTVPGANSRDDSRLQV